MVRHFELEQVPPRRIKSAKFLVDCIGCCLHFLRRMAIFVFRSVSQNSFSPRHTIKRLFIYQCLTVIKQNHLWLSHMLTTPPW